MTNSYNTFGTVLENDNEVLRLQAWDYLVDKLIPKLTPSDYWLKKLDNLLPDRCVFERTVRYKGVLVLYIPSLCQLNPFYHSIMSYRLEKIHNLESLFN